MDKNTKYIYVILISTVLLVFAQLTKNATLFAVSMSIVIFSWIFLGAAKNGKVSKPLGLWWGVSFVIMVGSLLAMLDIVKVPENITNSHFLGFPLPTAILFFSFWMLVGLITTITFSVRFEKDILNKEWVEEFEAKTGAVLLVKNGNEKEEA